MEKIERVSEKKRFYILYGEACAADDREVFVAEWATSSIFGDKAFTEEVVQYCAAVWDAAHMSVREMRDKMRMTQAELSEYFCIPKRTIENWEAGSRQAPEYIRLMMAKEFGFAPSAHGSQIPFTIICKPHMAGWNTLKNGAELIYRDGAYDFPGYKINDNHAVLINARGKFIIAKAYPNCLSIGSGYIIEYDTFEMAESSVPGETE